MTVMAIPGAMHRLLQAMAADDEPKLTVKPTGRVLMVGAVYLPDGDGLADDWLSPTPVWVSRPHYGKSGPERSMPGIRSEQAWAALCNGCLYTVFL